MTKDRIEETKENMLAKLMASDRYKQALGGLHKYTHPRGDYGDLVGIFNEGIMMGMESVNLKVGDPLEYLIYRGYAYMRSQIRNECNKTMLEECTSCGTIRPYRGTRCKCGCKDFIIHSRMTYIVIKDGEVIIPFTSYPTDFHRMCRGCEKSKVDEKKHLI